MRTTSTGSTSARWTRFSNARRVAPRISATGARGSLARPRRGLSRCRSAVWMSFNVGCDDLDRIDAGPRGGNRTDASSLASGHRSVKAPDVVSSADPVRRGSHDEDHPDVAVRHLGRVAVVALLVRLEERPVRVVLVAALHAAHLQAPVLAFRMVVRG